MSAADPEAPPPSRIVVVEDEDAIRNNLREMLEAEGYAVFEAKDGEEALRAVADEIPDLVVCDLMLPVHDGFEVLRRIRADAATCHVPFLFTTAVADRESRRRGMEMGAEDYVTKPFSRRELLAAVSVRIERSRSLELVRATRLAGLRNALSRALPHELLTPLNGILGLAGILVDDWETADRTEIRDVARDILRSGEQLHRLSARFLAYAELEMAALDPSRRALLRAQSCPSPVEVVRRVLRCEGGEPDRAVAISAGNLELLVRELSAWRGPFEFGRILSSGDPWRVEFAPSDGARRRSPEETSGSDLPSAIVESIRRLHGARISDSGSGCVVLEIRSAQAPKAP